MQADLDRVNRECMAMKLRSEEMEKSNAMMISQIANLSDENRNLVLMQETDKHAINRRDRKIEELRADLREADITRRKAEDAARTYSRTADEALEDRNRQVAEAREKEHRATTSYETLASSVKHLRYDYQRQHEKSKAQLLDLARRVENDQAKMERLAALKDQKDAEVLELLQKSDQMASLFERYKVEKDRSVADVRETAQRNEKAFEQAINEARHTTDKMKWVINVKEKVPGAE